MTPYRKRACIAPLDETFHSVDNHPFSLMRQFHPEYGKIG